MIRLAQALQAEPLPTPAGKPTRGEPLPVPPAPAGIPGNPGDGPQLPNQSALGPAAGPPLLHIEDVDVRKVFEMISRQGKMNILISPSVSGLVTLDLRGGSVEDELQAVAKLCHLTIKREKDLIYVYTKAELDLGDDLPVRVYHLNYARGSDLKKIITPLLTKRGTATASPDSEIGLKSDGDKSDTNKGYSLGKSEVLAGGNSLGASDMLIVQDCERVLLAIDRVVAQVDVQPVQVMIEAVILSVTLTDDMELGVDFASAAFSGQVANVFGNGALLNSAAGFTPATPIATAASIGSALNSGAAGSPAPLATPGQLSSGLAEAQHGYKFGYSSNAITAFIRALESRTDVKVLASPRLLVVNKQRAELQVGDCLGYTTSTTNMGTTTQTVNFMDVGTQLRLRPFVGSDGIIRMEIHPENSTGVLNTAGVPQTTGAHVTTNVMIPDGRTVVIGGLIEADRTYTKYGVPGLCNIPWIGGLFRQTVDTPVRKEMIVILTPHIWNPKAPSQLNCPATPPCIEAEKAAHYGHVVMPDHEN